MEKTDIVGEQSPPVAPPVPPPLPGPATAIYHRQGLMMNGSPLRGHCCVSTSTKNLWDGLFDGGYRADVAVNTDDGGVIFAHANILGMASPTLKGLLRQSKLQRPWPDKINIYRRCSTGCSSSFYPVFVLFVRLCEQQLEQGLLTLENVVDVFQLSLLCNAPRLSLMCHRMILQNFKAVSSTEGWNVMKKSHPVLEKELQVSVIEEENGKKARIKKLDEQKIYLQLYEAMEALVHICRDGCRTIGPHDRDLKENQTPCKYAACKGIESLVRHFAGCKLRVPGGCIHCKRMWQLLELHSRICADSNNCRVPLCGNFKEKIRKQNKKDEMKWKILVKKILRTKRIGGGPFSLSVNSSS